MYPHIIHVWIKCMSSILLLYSKKWLKIVIFYRFLTILRSVEVLPERSWRDHLVDWRTPMGSDSPFWRVLEALRPFLAWEAVLGSKMGGGGQFWGVSKLHTCFYMYAKCAKKHANRPPGVQKPNICVLKFLDKVPVGKRGGRVFSDWGQK